jgi:hypothetical protein
VASIIRMSHCLSASGSWSGTRPAAEDPALALTAARSAVVRRSTSSLAAAAPFGIRPMGRLRAAPTRAFWAAAADRNAGLADFTVATPTRVFSLRMVPPAALTAARAAAADAPSA